MCMHLYVYPIILQLVIKAWCPQRDKLTTLVLSLDEYQVKRIRQLERLVA